MNLKEAREKIDNIDQKIVELLDQRMKAVDDISQYKAIKGLPVLDEAREKEKLSKIKGDSNRRIFEKIMEESRAYQETHRPEYGLVGRKLSHSFSKEVHKMVGGYDYALIELEPEELEGFFKDGNFKGVNVTIPYKEEVMKYCKDLSEEAKEARSVNLISDGIGYNTDVYGFKKLLEKVGDFETVTILGDGGASKAIQSILRDKKVTVLKRGEMDKYVPTDLVINATPVGTYPDVDEAPIEIYGCKAVIDLTYNPFMTKLMLDAKEKGILAIGGLEMLFYQAAKSAEIFTGKKLTDLELAILYDQFEKEYLNVAIIGMPGSGKSTLGRKLAKDLGKTFIDLDDEIYSREGQTAEEIILFRGEKAFRDIETRVLEEISLMHGAVIATGGGIVERDENRRLLERNSQIIYLRRDLEDLEVFGRPLSKEEGVEALFERRGEKYEAWANLILEEEI
ncbi:MAG: chorismate mutase [Clostridia bacterium]|nr:chorismate mutase [Clostridia bacterium]